MNGFSLAQKRELRRVALDYIRASRSSWAQPLTDKDTHCLELARSFVDQTADLEKDEKRDEFITMKMLLCFKDLRRRDPAKPQPDVGWMECLLEASRAAGHEYDSTHIGEVRK